MFDLENPRFYIGVRTCNTEPEHEIQLHEYYDVAISEMFYNKAKSKSTGFDVTGVPRSESHRKKISESWKHRTGIKKTEEIKQKISNSHKQRSPEQVRQSREQARLTYIERDFNRFGVQNKR